MYVFDFSNKNKSLPLVSSWLNPIYGGPGDLRVAKITGKTYHEPRNWRTDFPDYNYQYPKLLTMKAKLNTTKRQLDPIRLSDNETYSKITAAVRVHDDLRGKYGIVTQEYGGEVVTNAWLKMYELCILLNTYLGKLKHLNSFHFAEAPGNFMLAINHYLANHFPDLKWSWLANSYRELYAARSKTVAARSKGKQTYHERNVGYLVDTYGLMAQYNDRWIYGVDGDGDITSVANIRSFTAAAGLQTHLVTSDVKYVPQEVNFDEEENINVPVHMGHLLCALLTLSKGGVMILKEFTFFEAPSVALLWLMVHCFDKLSVVKPETSRPANSEVYIVGFGYKNNITALQRECLLNYMNYIRSLNNEGGSPALFKKNAIPPEFVNQVIALMSELVEAQIPEINRNIHLYKQYKSRPLRRARQDMSAKREKVARAWVKKVKLAILPENKRIAC